MGNFKNKIISFMYGRNGPDALYRALSWVALVLLIVSTFVRLFSPLVGYILYALAMIALVLAMFRSFSRNLQKRQAENEKYLKVTSKIRKHFALCRNRAKYRKTSIYVKCPNCKNVLRFQRVLGVHTAKCPCCKHSFELKIK